MDKAKRARASAKTQLSKVSNFLKNEANTASPSKLSVKLEILEKYYAAFHKAQDEIEGLITNDDDLNKEIEESEAFDELYCNLKAELIDLIAKVTPSTASANSIPNSQPVCHNHEERFFKLPTLNIKPFDGSYLEWTSFKDMFLSMIGSYSRISDVDKLCVLKTLVVGEPYNMIKTLGNTTQNYAEAWNRLDFRYSNERLIIKAHLSQIFSLEKCITGNVTSLKTVLDSVTAHVRALENLGLESSTLSDAMLFHIVTSKLDQRTKDLFDEERNPDPDATNYTRLIKFMTSRVNTLADLPSGKDLQPTPQPKSTKRTTEVKAHQITTPTPTPTPTPPLTKPRGCIECGDDHPLFKCPKFTQKTVPQRFETVKNLKTPICFNCFRSNHQATKCTDKNSCKECGLKHHTLLHFTKDPNLPKQNEVITPPEASGTSGATANICTITQLSTNQVLLATVSLLMKDVHGNYQPIRAFLDPGAQANLITKSAVDKLKLPTSSFSLTLTGVTNLKRQSNKIVECEIASRVTDFNSNLHAVVVPQICSLLPAQSVFTAKLPLHDKVLADPEFHKPNNIDLLLCGEHYLDLFIDGHIPATNESPSMQNTVFGWIIAGKSVVAKSTQDTHEVLANFCSVSLQPETMINHCAISASLEKFWSIEDVNITQSDLTLEEKACVEHFEETVTRLPDGRFEVAIPLKSSPAILGKSRDIAAKVLQYTQRRLDPIRKAEYQAVMDEYIRLGHLVKISNPDMSIPHAYLPHHPVIKTTSKTTKLRVVFNGAKPTSNGVAVNDIHMRGPTVQNDLFSILVRFRCRIIAICADIEMMYRQMRARKRDQELQRILWYDDEGNIADFYSTTITFGLTSSAHLAIFCLRQLAKDDGHKHPLAAAALLDDFYVDDGLTGANSKAQAEELIRQLNDLTAKGCLTLRKWVSNEPSVLQGLPQRDSNVEFLLNSDEKVGTLGVSWLPSQDLFVLKVNLEETPNFNKRNILSEVAKILDPLGLAAPVVVNFKLFLRELWKRGCNWDEPLDPDLCEQWRLYRSSIMSLRIECPRLVMPSSTFEIHGFCDASKQAFCACLYIRCSVGEKFVSQLLCSKTRVAPLQDLHIHRLELMGAVLLAKLCSKVVKILPEPPVSTQLWCDSQVTLAWIQRDPDSLKTFVGNRMKSIRELFPPQSWSYVNTAQNPADIGSRGSTGENLQQSLLWWNGPSFLNDENLPIQINLPTDIPEAIRELRTPRVHIMFVNLIQDFKIFDRFNSATELIRGVAWWLRYKQNLRPRNRTNRDRTPQIASELANAKRVLIRLAQGQDFDVEKLKRRGKVSKKNNLRLLAPFIDEHDIIRVGGRLENAQIPYRKRHPIVLSGTHPLAAAIVYDQHRIFGHPPFNLAMAVLREEYWVIGAKKLIKRVTNDCITCIKSRAKFVTQQMGQLPPDRVNIGFPFQNVGLDYGGPIEIVRGATRRPIIEKAYICLFVCLATKAVHLEAVTSLSSKAFLDALQRFTSRRGLPALIRSDNGTNFRGAYNDLIRIIREEPVQKSTAQSGISWEFIPPSAPHFGGIWEAGIKSTKSFLAKLTDRRLNYEEFNTILVKIEGFLNSRPLSPLSDDVNDLEALTPGHFLIGRPLFALPERNQIDSKDNRDRFVMRQKLLQTFWKDWQNEYLHRLQERPKWTQPQPNLREGQLVLCREITSPQTWMLGRVVKLFPGQDGLVRVVEIRTSKGNIKRPVVKLIAL